MIPRPELLEILRVALSPRDRLVRIFRGLPGSGKTRRVRRLRGWARCSADDFFETPTGYRFDPLKLSLAHRACLRAFLGFVEAGCPRIAVDNTNITAAEIAPYAAIGEAFGYRVEILTLWVSVRTAQRRNVHSVPLKAIQAMAARLAKERLPPWWRNVEVRP